VGVLVGDGEVGVGLPVKGTEHARLAMINASAT
jgi:hypothetical protein